MRPRSDDRGTARVCAVVQGIAFTKENAVKMVAEQKKLAAPPAK